MSVTAIIQARMGSTRLPGKTMMEIAGKPILQHVVERVSACPGVKRVIVATSADLSDLVILDWCRTHVIECVATDKKLDDGKNDVLYRYAFAIQKTTDHVFMRVTADCPLWCPELGQEVIEAFYERPINLCSNVHPQLDGFDTEVFTRDALLGAHRMADLPYDRHHVTPYLYKRVSQHWVDQLAKVGGMKVSVDTEEDFQLVGRILDRTKNFSLAETIYRHKEVTML